MEEYDDVLFVIMHLLEMQGKEISVGEVAIFVGQDFVLSIRSVAARVSSASGPVPNANRTCCAMARATCSMRWPTPSSIAICRSSTSSRPQLEDVEAKIFVTGAARENVRELYSLKQKVMIIRHAIMPVIEGIDKLHGGRVPRVVQELGEYFRDVFDHLYRVQTSAEAVREMIITAINVNLAMVTIDQSEVAKRLAAWAAIFAAMTRWRNLGDELRAHARTQVAARATRWRSA